MLVNTKHTSNEETFGNDLPTKNRWSLQHRTTHIDSRSGRVTFFAGGEFHPDPATIQLRALRSFLSWGLSLWRPSSGPTLPGRSFDPCRACNFKAIRAEITSIHMIWCSKLLNLLSISFTAASTTEEVAGSLFKIRWERVKYDHLHGCCCGARTCSRSVKEGPQWDGRRQEHGSAHPSSISVQNKAHPVSVSVNR